MERSSLGLRRLGVGRRFPKNGTVFFAKRHMAIAIDEFWRLAIEGGLFEAAERQELMSAFDRGGATVRPSRWRSASG